MGNKEHLGKFGGAAQSFEVIENLSDKQHYLYFWANLQNHCFSRWRFAFWCGGNHALPLLMYFNHSRYFMGYSVSNFGVICMSWPFGLEAFLLLLYFLCLTIHLGVPPALLWVTEQGSIYHAILWHCLSVTSTTSNPVHYHHSNTQKVIKLEIFSVTVIYVKFCL